MFKPNEGSLDRIVRAIVGVLLIALALSLTGWLKIVLLIIAVVILITAAIGYCGIYQVCHINTLDKNDKPEPTPQTDFDLKKEVDEIKPVAKPEASETIAEATKPEPDEAEIETEETEAESDEIDAEISTEAKSEDKEDTPEEKI